MNMFKAENIASTKAAAKDDLVLHFRNVDLKVDINEDPKHDVLKG